MSKYPWIRLGGKIGEWAHCQHCGAGLDLGPNGQPVTIFFAAMKAFKREHRHCVDRGWKEPPIHTSDDWIKSRVTGVSSATIWSVMTGEPSPYGRYDTPKDGADFWRCVNLIRLFPHWKLHLGDMVAKYPEWASVVKEWDDWEGALKQNADTR